MNSDDLMSDPAVPTPSDSTKGAATPAWNSKKFREEYDVYKRRLQDQKFSVGKFANLGHNSQSLSCHKRHAGPSYGNGVLNLVTRRNSRLPRPAGPAAAASEAVPQGDRPGDGTAAAGVDCRC